MLLDHTLNFRIRHYECDANGHLNHANYLRYIHETNISALATAGYNLNRLASLNLVWRPRDVYIDYLRPLFFGDQVRVCASLTNIYENRAVWDYDFKKPDSQNVYATSQINSVLMNSTNDLPVQIPQELAAAVQPAGANSGSHTPILFPALAPRPPGAFIQRWQVEWRDVDPDLSLNIAAYADYLLEFVLNAAAACGWTFEHSHHEGFASYIRRQWLRILEPVRLGEELELTTWLSNVKRATVMRHFTIQRVADGQEIGQSHTLWACVDPRSGRPVRIPEAWARDFAPQISKE